MAELFDSLSFVPVLRTFVRYLIAFCSRPEEASDVISGVVVDPTSLDIHVKFGDSWSNRSQDIRLPHFVTDERRRLMDPAIISVKIY